MAIYKLIQNTSFEPKDIEHLVAAYEQTLRALRLKDRSDPITQLVAEKIIAIGRLRIEDPAEISKLVLKELTTWFTRTSPDPLDRRVLRVLHLDPIRRAAGAVGPITALRHHAVAPAWSCAGRGRRLHPNKRKPRASLCLAVPSSCPRRRPWCDAR